MCSLLSRCLKKCGFPMMTKHRNRIPIYLRNSSHSAMSSRQNGQRPYHREKTPITLSTSSTTSHPGMDRSIPFLRRSFASLFGILTKTSPTDAYGCRRVPLVLRFSSSPRKMVVSASAWTTAASTRFLSKIVIPCLSFRRSSTGCLAPNTLAKSMSKTPITGSVEDRVSHPVRPFRIYCHAIRTHQCTRDLPELHPYRVTGASGPLLCGIS